MNNVSLVGRLVRDPELRTISTGNTTCSFTIAINRTFANASGERETDFINCVVWGKSAENLCKYCTKGSLVGVSGRIQTRNYDAQDGRKVYVTEVVANNVSFLGSKNTQSEASFEEAGNLVGNSNPIGTTDFTEDPFKDFGSEVILSDDDLPF